MRRCVIWRVTRSWARRIDRDFVGTFLLPNESDSLPTRASIVLRCLSLVVRTLKWSRLTPSCLPTSRGFFLPGVYVLACWGRCWSLCGSELAREGGLTAGLVLPVVHQSHCGSEPARDCGVPVDIKSAEPTLSRASLLPQSIFSGPSVFARSMVHQMAPSLRSLAICCAS